MIRGVFFAMVGAILACDSESDEPQINGEVIEVACATCIFQMPGTSGCSWAAHVDGEYYQMTGPVPMAHDKHAPDGICRMPREARVIGSVQGDYFVADEFQLLPAEEIPESAEMDHDHAH